jgi:receptor protein-tyrosine kinase
MSERLNLIQRAMQLGALAREPAPADGGVFERTSERPTIAPSEPASNGVAFPLRNGADLGTFKKHAEPVHLDHALLRASRIVTPENKNSVTYNEFRSIKRKLIPMTHDGEKGPFTRNTVMVTSALPSEGKTFTAMNLAIALAAEPNLEVILVDGDVVQSSVSRYFHGENQDGLLELLTGKRERLEDVLHPCADLPRLHVLFGGNRNDAAPELLASRRMAEVCASLSTYFPQGIVIFDMPPVLSASEPAAMAAHADHLIMVVAAARAARHQVEAALTEVSRCPSISLVFNRSPEWERPITDLYSAYAYGLDKSKEA